MLTAVAIFQVVLVGAYLSALDRPTMRQVPVAVVGSTQSVDDLASRAGNALSIRQEPDEPAAIHAIQTRKVYAALILTGPAAKLLLASAGSPAAAQALTKVFTATAMAAGQQLAIQDINPLPHKDPRGMGPMFLVLAWALGGYIGAMVLGRALGMRSPRLGHLHVRLDILALYALAAAALTIGLADGVMGVTAGHPIELILVGALTIFAIGCFTSAMQSLFGLAGALLSVCIVVLLGNPAAGGGQVPPELMPAFWGTIAEGLPNPSGIHLVRSILSFGGHDITANLLTLVCWALGSFVIMALLTLRRQRPSTPAGTASQSHTPTIDPDTIEAETTTIAVAGTAI